MNKMKKLENKITNSNFKISKNFIWFIIAPIIILLLSVILIPTIGFNLGTDFTGYSSFKVYVNNENTFDAVESYDLKENVDYNEVYDKINTILKDNELKVVSIRISSINLMEDYNIADGQALEVLFQNSCQGQEKINVENENLRQELIAEFGYENYENAITSVDFSDAKPSFNWLIGLLSAVVFALLAVIIYMMFRYNKSAWIVLILQAGLDMLLFVGLLSIFRLTVNFTIGISILATFVLTILNAFVFYAKMKENLNAGKFTNLKNSEMADKNVKEYLFKKILIYVVMFIFVFLLAIISAEVVREVALGLSIGLLVTFFTSTFFTPAVWSVVYKEKKIKK